MFLNAEEISYKA
jgi:hypothetical protein